MKDRLNPCIYYICANTDCKKGIKSVTLDKCKNCSKYRGRKSNHRPESVKNKREKDKNRHTNYYD